MGLRQLGQHAHPLHVAGIDAVAAPAAAVQHGEELLGIGGELFGAGAVSIGIHRCVPVGPAPLALRCCSTSAAVGAHDLLLAIAEEAAGTGGHVLRHTFGTHLVREGHDIVLVVRVASPSDVRQE
jgi:hypothetical protein